jgi:hypothetical protein
MSRSLILSILLLVSLLFVSANRAETVRDLPLQPQSRIAKIHGKWQLDPLSKYTQHLPEHDKWQLVINPDGTASYTGLLPRLVEETIDPASEKAVPSISSSSRLEIKHSSVSGEWDLSEEYLSIVSTDGPSIFKFKVHAITANHFVLEPESGTNISGAMFWTRIPKMQ